MMMFGCVLWFFCMLHHTVGLAEEDFTDNELGREFWKIRYNVGQRFVLFPDGGGKIHIIDMEKSVVDHKFNAKKDVVVLIYSWKNLADPVIIMSHNKTNMVNPQYVNISKPFKVLVHGWNDDRNGDLSVDVRDAFLDFMDVNVMVIDWSEGSKGHYAAAVSNAPKTAEYLASLINWLISKGIPADNFHFVGHSLGAHVVGITARYVQTGKIPYITGLDPALPLWDKYSKRMKSSDGKYVEIIHTNGGLFGVEDALGSNDFYPNGGFIQPGCGIFGFGCSHKRALQYFAESIGHDKFTGIQCTDLKELLDRRCSNLTSLKMGGASIKPPAGIFYLQTKKQPPFYLG